VVDNGPSSVMVIKECWDEMRRPGDAGSSAGVRGASVEALEVLEEATPCDKRGLGEIGSRGDTLNSLDVFDFEVGSVRWSGGSWMSTGCCFFDLEPKPMTAAKLNLEDDLEETGKALGDVGLGLVTEVING